MIHVKQNLTRQNWVDSRETLQRDTLFHVKQSASERQFLLVLHTATL